MFKHWFLHILESQVRVENVGRDDRLVNKSSAWVLEINMVVNNDYCHTNINLFQYKKLDWIIILFLGQSMHPKSWLKGRFSKICKDLKTLGLFFRSSHLWVRGGLWKLWDGIRTSFSNQAHGHIKMHKSRKNVNLCIWNQIGSWIC